MLEIVDTLPALEGFEDQWLGLFESIPEATFFQHPRWLLTWWKHLGSGCLRCLLWRNSGHAAALIPCFLHNWESRQQLTLIGTGVSDYLDPLIQPEAIDGCIETLQEYLEGSREWEVCDWQDLSMNSPLLKLRSSAMFEVRVSRDTPCSQIPLSGSFNALWDSRSKDLRRNLRRYSERAKNLGAVQFEVCLEARPEWLDSLVRLHGERWERRGEAGMIATNRSEHFLRGIAEEFAALGMLRFFGVRFKGQLAASVLTFLNHNQIFSYISALDPEYGILGFGRLLLYEAIRYSYEQGYSAWNFLRGGEPYKFSWGAQPIPKYRITLRRRTY